MKVGNIKVQEAMLMKMSTWWKEKSCENICAQSLTSGVMAKEH